MKSLSFIDALKDADITFFTGVPDSYLHGFCSALQEKTSSTENIITANEGNAIGVAAGYHLATSKTPLVYMQNSGLGNAINPLVSLACEEMLGIPMILLIGWRGDPCHPDHIQHALQGRITPLILQDLGIPFRTLQDDESAIRETVQWAAREADSRESPIAILVPKGVLSGTKHPPNDTSYPLSREEAIGAILDSAPQEALISATTGRASRELFHIREARKEGHSKDYLNVGSMGHASSVALGIALANPDRQVICLDGDSAAIMHMGALTMPSKLAIPNLLHVILNNGAHESVGGQPSAGQLIDFTKIADSCGYRTVGEPAMTKSGVIEAVQKLCACDEAGFLDVRIRSGMRSDMPGLEIAPKLMRDELMMDIRAFRSSEKLS